MRISEWKARLRMEREQKDMFFSIHPQSPIPPEERGGRLDYYPPVPTIDSSLNFMSIQIRREQRSLIQEVRRRGSLDGVNSDST